MFRPPAIWLCSDANCANLSRDFRLHLRRLPSTPRQHAAPFDMRTHNPFLKERVEGCDGFKTGYTASAGWSIVVTSKRNGRRVIVVVLQ